MEAGLMGRLACCAVLGVVPLSSNQWGCASRACVEGSTVAVVLVCFTEVYTGVGETGRTEI